MTFLELCQKVHLILRIGSESPGTEPTTVVGQVGVPGEIVQWVAHSHDDICRYKTDWAFMNGSDDFTLLEGDREIDVAALVATAADFGKVLPFVYNDGAFVGLLAAGVADSAEQVVKYITYQEWRGHYDAPPISEGTPTYFTIKPDRGMEFDATADRDYTIRTNYKKAVVALAVDADEPMFDAEYHNAIVWWAIVHYYCPSRDKTGELRQKAEVELRREMTKLFNEQLPDFVAY